MAGYGKAVEVRCGLLRLVEVSRGAASSGMVRRGSLGMLWSDGVGQGKARIGVAVKVRRRWARRGTFWNGAAVVVSPVTVRSGQSWRDEERQSRQGQAKPDAAGHGLAWQSGRVKTRFGKSWQVPAGFVRAWQSRFGKLCSGLSRQGKARQSGRARVLQGIARTGKPRSGSHV